jgi:anti-sigma B factor antagonist
MTNDSGGPILEIEAEQTSTTYHVKLSGEVDLASAEALEEAIRHAEESDADRILVDLEGLDFIDSTGLGTLLEAARRSEANGDRIRFTRGRDSVAELLRLTAIDQTLRYA